MTKMKGGRFCHGGFGQGRFGYGRFGHRHAPADVLVAGMFKVDNLAKQKEPHKSLA